MGENMKMKNMNKTAIKKFMVEMGFNVVRFKNDMIFQYDNYLVNVEININKITLFIMNANNDKQYREMKICDYQFVNTIQMIINDINENILF